MSELLTVRVHCVDLADSGSEAGGPVTVVTASGEIDLHTAPLLTSALREAIDGARRLVVVDLTEVTFMASSGLAALLGGLDHAERRSCRIVLAGGGRPVHRPLRAAGLEGRFEYAASAAEAVRSG